MRRWQYAALRYTRYVDKDETPVVIYSLLSPNGTTQQVIYEARRDSVRQDDNGVERKLWTIRSHGEDGTPMWATGIWHQALVDIMTRLGLQGWECVAAHDEEIEAELHGDKPPSSRPAVANYLFKREVEESA